MKQFIPVALLLTAGAIAVTAVSLRSRTDSEIADYRPPVLPSRTSVSPPAIPEPPSVPEGADVLSPISFTVTTTWADPQGQRRASQRVTRTTDRIHLLMEGTQKEWLLERNPLDRRRVSGYLIDHRSRQILTHQESDLRSEQQLRGWTDALMMRFDSSVLSSLRRTNRDDAVFGATFTRHLAQDQAREGVMEVWWSDALLLPLRLKVRQRGVIVTSVVDAIERVEHPETLAVLADPRTRFREYEILDVTDSRERRH
jgi:hypothetical protein